LILKNYDEGRFLVRDIAPRETI